MRVQLRCKGKPQAYFASAVPAMWLQNTWMASSSLLDWPTQTPIQLWVTASHSWWDG
jgi:hypothetical protein